GAEGDVPLLQRGRPLGEEDGRLHPDDGLRPQAVRCGRRHGALRGLARRGPYRVLSPLQRRLRQASRDGPALEGPAQDLLADPAAVGPGRPDDHFGRRADHAEADPRRPAARVRQLRALGPTGASARLRAPGRGLPGGGGMTGWLGGYVALVTG